MAFFQTPATYHTGVRRQTASPIITGEIYFISLCHALA
jgi:hypothetical protein